MLFCFETLPLVRYIHVTEILVLQGGCVVLSVIKVLLLIELTTTYSTPEWALAGLSRLVFLRSPNTYYTIKVLLLFFPPFSSAKMFF